MSRPERGVELISGEPRRSTAAMRLLSAQVWPLWLWIGFGACAAVIMVADGWIADRVGNGRLRDAGAHRLELYAAGLTSELAKYEYLPGLLTQERDVFAALRSPLDADAVRRLNERLERLNQIAGTAVLYVLDRTGRAIASSD